MLSGGVRSLWALLFGFALLTLGNGLQGTLLGVRAAMEEFGPFVTGIVMAGYSLGLLAGSITTPALVSYVGHIRVFAALASVVSTAVLLLAVFVNPVWWFVMRFVAGMCISGLFIVAESWLNSVSTNQNRGRLLSVYMAITYACMGLGQLFLNLADPGGFELFIVVSALVSLALVPISLVRTAAPDIAHPRAVAVADIYKGSPLAVIASFANGAGQAAFFSMGAVYATLSGFTVAETSVLMALPPLGVVLSQYPIGLLSDRYDRRLMLAVLSFVSAVIAAGCALATGRSEEAVILLFMLFGALSLPLYSITLAHANDHLEPDQMLGASGKLILLYGVGAIVGPLLAGGAMRFVGAAGFAYYLCALYGLMGIYVVYRMYRRPEVVPVEDQGEFVLVAPRTTQVTAQAIAEEIVEADTAATGDAAKDGDSQPAPAGEAR